MHLRNRTFILPVIALLFFGSLESFAQVMHMDLDTLTKNSGQVFRGKLEKITSGRLRIGGGEIPTTTYLFSVSMDLKGSFALGQGNEKVAELTVIAKDSGNQKGNSDPQFVSNLPDPPRFSLGREYLVFATSPSAVGLCTTVGLGQGYFKIYQENKTEYAVNELNNAGLFGVQQSLRAAQSGPIAFDELSARIATAVRQGGK